MAFQVRDEWEHNPASGMAASALASIPPCSPVHVDNHKASAPMHLSLSLARSLALSLSLSLSFARLKLRSNPPSQLHVC